MADQLAIDGDLSLTHQLKRKRGDSDASSHTLSGRSPRQDHSPAVASGEEHEDDDGAEEDDSDDDDDISEVSIEDLVESIAATDYGHELKLLCTPAEVRSKVREVGIDAFVADLVERSGKTIEQIGASYGLPAEAIPDREQWLYVLSQILVSSLIRRRKLSQYNTIDDAAELLKRSKNIMVITGAGISTSLGIPDFRSKNTGFYSKLQGMGYSEPEDVFDIHIFREDPKMFYSLAGDILPQGKRFTPTHGFIRLLQDKGRLQTNYTQNIDNMEANAGIDASKVIQCHGSFATASCQECKIKVPGEEIFDSLRSRTVAYCKECPKRIDGLQTSKPSKKLKHDFDDDDEDDDIPQVGVMKPDITFFGEQLPDTFFDRFLNEDSHRADLAIVIGTSLKVAPVADMPNHLPEHIPHIYISREPCRHINFDIQLLGDCDAVCWELSKRAGWHLKHEMVPAGFATKVDAYEESGHEWTVSAIDKTIGLAESEKVQPTAIVLPDAQDLSG